MQTVKPLTRSQQNRDNLTRSRLFHILFRLEAVCSLAPRAATSMLVAIVRFVRVKTNKYGGTSLGAAGRPAAINESTAFSVASTPACIEVVRLPNLFHQARLATPQPRVHNLTRRTSLRRRYIPKTPFLVSDNIEASFLAVLDEEELLRTGNHWGRFQQFRRP